MKSVLVAGSILLLLTPPGSSQQAPSPARAGASPGAFPEQLLEGMQKFDLALQFHSDIRGNIGPCG